jgi:hypothetical protein
LEKAYAKLNLCYEFLNGGDPIDAMIDMTGGIKYLKSVPKNPFFLVYLVRPSKCQELANPCKMLV